MIFKMQATAMALLVLGIVGLSSVAEALEVILPDPACYEDNPMGRDYRGSVSMTRYGNECMHWSAQNPHVHNRTAENYPDTGLGDHNYCRNPDNEPEGPWCFTTDPGLRWEYCGVGMPSRDCYYGECHDAHYNGQDYLGAVSATADGTTCQKWTEQTPHKHTRIPVAFPDTGLGDHNYCRNPDGEPNGPWCFTTNSTIRWAYCNVGPANCKGCDNECYTDDPMGRDYRGIVKETTSGKSCMYWASQDPHVHNRTADNYPNTGLYGDHNFCRNPDNEPLGPWCFTTDPDSRWEYCDVVEASESCVEEEGAEYWKEHTKKEIQEALLADDKIIKGIAKNVVIMVADGLDLPTVTASRIFKTGACGKLVFETLPHTGLAKTYNCDSQVPDSGSAATALFSGVKAPSRTLGVDCSAQFGNCSTLASASVTETLVNDFIACGKSTGFVTTASVSGAFSGALYGSTVNSSWEYNVPEDAANDGCTDLASQLLDSGLNVVMGGGRKGFLPTGTRDPEYSGQNGARTDGRNLVREWLRGHDNAEYVWNNADFLDVDIDSTDNLLGLFEPRYMRFEAERGQDGSLEPTISEMTKKAIKILKKNENGFLLVVHGGILDTAHHQNSAYKALMETCSFDAAVAKVMELVDLDETLLIVTSDHAQAMSMVGYPSRENPILGKNDLQYGSDGLPFTTLQYNMGPSGMAEHSSFTDTGNRRDLSDVDTAHPGFRQSALVPLKSSKHAGQDVPIYAAGPMAHMFHTTHEQTFIPFVAQMAACVGKYKDKCPRVPEGKKLRKQIVPAATPIP